MKWGVGYKWWRTFTNKSSLFDMHNKIFCVVNYFYKYDATYLKTTAKHHEPYLIFPLKFISMSLDWFTSRSNVEHLSVSILKTRQKYDHVDWRQNKKNTFSSMLESYIVANKASVCNSGLFYAFCTQHDPCRVIFIIRPEGSASGQVFGSLICE